MYKLEFVYVCGVPARVEVLKPIIEWHWSVLGFVDFLRIALVTWSAFGQHFRNTLQWVIICKLLLWTHAQEAT